MMLRLAAPAKINLYLHITGKRADGYHELDTVFQLVDLFDTVRLTVRSDGEIRLHTPIAGLADEQHLAVRAAQALKTQSQKNTQKHTPNTLGADIWVDKRIPSGAGLGGGSSDAASTLMGLNRLWACGLTRLELQALGLQLGADVPFFCSQLGTARATGVGERLHAVSTPNHAYIVVFPDCHVPTPAVFQHPSLNWQAPHAQRQATLAAGATVNHRGNDLQATAQVIAISIARACTWLESAPAQLGVCMSGSGSAVFAQFETLSHAKIALSSLKKNRPTGSEGWFIWALNGLAKHPFT